jgi:hypothetical protein
MLRLAPSDTLPIGQGEVGEKQRVDIARGPSEQHRKIGSSRLIRRSKSFETATSPDM